MILVTGVNGFLGSLLLNALLTEGYAVKGVSRRYLSIKSPRFQSVIVDDISKEHSWDIDLVDVDTIIHVAGRAHVMRDSNAHELKKYQAVNVFGTVNLAEQAAKAGVKRFIFISSIKVNGEFTGNDNFFTANDIPNPSDAYAVSKFEAEEGLREIALQSGMEFVIIRPPLIYGPGVKANFLKLFRWVQGGKPLPLGLVKNIRSLVGVSNLIDFIMVCIEHKAAANEVFLVSDGEDISIVELLDAMGIALNRPVRLISLPLWILFSVGLLMGQFQSVRRLTDSLRVDISKNRELLGWAPKYSVSFELKKLQAFLEYNL